MSKIIVSSAMNMEATHQAFPYQMQAFMELKDKDYCAIFHEQGLGKTKIAIDLILYWLTHRGIDTVMVVTKKQLVENWRGEFSFHTHISPKILTTDRKNNFYVLNGTSRVILTNFETLSAERERVALYLKTRDVAIVIDESTKIKNPESKLTRDFFALSKLFKIRAIMTGTPVANRPYDIWSQIYFLDQGESLGKDFESFKRHTDLSNDLYDSSYSRKVFEQTVASIYSKIEKFTVRETKKSSGIVLPKKEYIFVDAQFENDQNGMYYKLIHECALEVEKNGQTFLDDDDAVLKRLLRLNQLASNPKLVDDSYSKLSGKEIELDGLLREIIARGEKCIVWSCFIENVNMFCKKYSALGAAKIHGGMAIADRNKSVSRFKTDPDCNILFATPQSAKEGLTLTVANNVVFYDRGFNLDDYLQAQDRIHRISQKRNCRVYNIRIAGSIDDWIEQLLEAKQSAAFLAQGDIKLSEYVRVADYSYGWMIKDILEREDKK